MTQTSLLHQSLSRSQLFESLTAEQISIIGEHLEKLHFRPGEDIIRQGEEGDRLYVVLEGEVTVVVEDSELGYEYPILNLGPGETFGELALFTQHPRAATVRAEVESTCASLQKGVFQQLLDELPKVSVSICRYLADRILRQSEATGLRHINLRADDVKPELYRLLPMPVWQRFQALPVGLEGKRLQIAVTRPEDLSIVNALKAQLPDYDLRWVVCNLEDYIRASHRFEKAREFKKSKTIEASDIEFEAYHSGTAAFLFAKALEKGATEIHIEPTAYGEARARFLIEGRFLTEAVERVEREGRECMEMCLASVCKGGVRGWGEFQFGCTRREFFVHRIETRFGVRLRIRIPKELRPDLGGLFRGHAVSQAISDHFRARSLTLVSGPPGAGVTTTLYCFVESLCNKDVETVIFVERCSARTLDAVTQVHYLTTEEQLERLKEALDQNPHTLVVDRLESREALMLVLEAARYGCRVLASCLPEWLEEFRERAVGARIDGLYLQQKLLPMTCDECREEVTHPDYAFKVFDSTGCPACQGSGRRGQIAAFESELHDRDGRVAYAFRNGEKDLLKKGLVSPYTIV